MGCSESRESVDPFAPAPKKPSLRYQFEIYAAIKSGKKADLQELLYSKFEINCKMPAFMGRTPLHIAAEFGNLEIISFLLQADADINSLDSSGCPPIYIAMQSGDLKVVELLLESQANIYIITNHNLCFHNYINSSKHKESMSLLKKIKYTKLNIQ